MGNSQSIPSSGLGGGAHLMVCYSLARDHRNIHKDDGKFYFEYGELDVAKRKILGGNW